MADVLHDLLSTEGRQGGTPGSGTGFESGHRSVSDGVAQDYLSTLAAMPLSQLMGAEQQSLNQSSHSLLVALQHLSGRSHRFMIDSAASHANLATSLPVLASSTNDLTNAIPKLDNEAVRFSSTYHKSTENELLNARKRALLLSRNVERLVDVLELPTLLSTSIATGSSSPTASYGSALDLNGHIRRLHSLYPTSALVSSVSSQADDEMQIMAKNLVASLRTTGLKMATALKTISWLRRVSPDIDPNGAAGNGSDIGAIFLVCRLSTLMNMLAALEPLRELAEQEKTRQRQQQQQQTHQKQSGAPWAWGQQTERYLKRYIEIFREQSFAIISMYKSIFPSQDGAKASSAGAEEDPLQPLPSALSTFPFHLIEMLMGTLREYLPSVKDQQSRDSLLTQVLYCAGSLGRLGGDFGVLLSSIDAGDDAEDEWVEVVKRHRLMTGRLESIVGTKGKGASETSLKV